MQIVASLSSRLSKVLPAMKGGCTLQQRHVLTTKTPPLIFRNTCTTYTALIFQVHLYNVSYFPSTLVQQTQLLFSKNTCTTNTPLILREHEYSSFFHEHFREHLYNAGHDKKPILTFDTSTRISHASRQE